MALAAVPDTACIDIPFLIRGRIVEPGGDDAVEMGGRVGARFRTPDPLRHARELVLSRPGDLRDLRLTLPLANQIRATVSPHIERLGVLETCTAVVCPNREEP